MNDQSNRQRASAPADPSAPVRVAIISDGVGDADGLAHGWAQVRERGIPGHAIDWVGSDALTDGRYDVIHVCEPAPTTAAALRMAHRMEAAVVASHHTASLHSDHVLAALYGRCAVVLSPHATADARLAQLNVGHSRIRRWDRGVDLERFHPARYCAGALPEATFNVLHVGRLDTGAGIELLLEAFSMARDRDPRLHLVLAGRGPAEPRMRRQLGNAATFLGGISQPKLAEIYATADLLVCLSITAGANAILEAQASGLPVLAVDGEGSRELIDSGRSGCLVPAEPDALASVIRGLTGRAAILDRLSTGGLAAVRGRTWERSLQQLADGWRSAMSVSPAARGVPRAA